MSIWKNKAILRVAFFAWSTTLRKILTTDNSRKRHISMVDWCCMCKKSGETIDNFVFHCEMVSSLWNTIFRSFWVKVGHASTSSGSLLVREGNLVVSKCNSVEEDSVLLNVCIWREKMIEVLKVVRGRRWN
jgi:hypothetical protein